LLPSFPYVQTHTVSGRRKEAIEFVQVKKNDLRTAPNFVEPTFASLTQSAAIRRKACDSRDKIGRSIVVVSPLRHHKSHSIDVDTAFVHHQAHKL